MPDSSAAPDVLCRRIENAIGIIGLRVRPNGVDLAPALTSSPCPEPDDEAKFASIVRHFDDGSVALEVTVLAACAALALATCALAVALP